MIISQFIDKANDLGFGTVASLNIEEAEAAIAKWKTYLREGDFAIYLETDPRKVLPEVKTLLLLAYPYRLYERYPDGAGRVSGYYVASNKAFHALDELAESLRLEGVNAVRTHRLPQKPLAVAAGLGRYGRNGIIVRKGTHFVLGLLLIDAVVELPRVQVPVPSCGSCGACERACPTGCLKDGYVNASRCLRTYMTHDIDAIPDDMRPLMGERLIGCDECLNACPGLTRNPVPEEFKNLFNWEALADPEKFHKNKPAIAELIGSNNTNAMHERAKRTIIRQS